MVPSRCASRRSSPAGSCPGRLPLAVGCVILAGYTLVNAIMKAELFLAEIRPLGVGLGYALVNSAFCGTAVRPIRFNWAPLPAKARQLALQWFDRDGHKTVQGRIEFLDQKYG